MLLLKVLILEMCWGFFFFFCSCYFYAVRACGRIRFKVFNVFPCPLSSSTLSDLSIPHSMEFTHNTCIGKMRLSSPSLHSADLNNNPQGTTDICLPSFLSDTNRRTATPQATATATSTQKTHLGSDTQRVNMITTQLQDTHRTSDDGLRREIRSSNTHPPRDARTDIGQYKRPLQETSRRCELFHTKYLNTHEVRDSSQ